MTSHTCEYGMRLYVRPNCNACISMGRMPAFVIVGFVGERSVPTCLSQVVERLLLA